MSRTEARLHPVSLLRKHYQHSPEALQIILDHSRQVCARAVRIARHLQASQTVDIRFIAEAAMLHDIGSKFTNAPELGCHGDLPYLCHGIRGSELLIAEGLPQHARVCENHIGVGLTAREITANNLPLPARDMLPLTLEEEIICYADLFYSKNLKQRGREKSVAQVRRKLLKHGPEKTRIFDRWRERFEPDLS